MEKVPMKQMKSNIWKFKLIKAWMETKIIHVGVKPNKANAML